MCLTQRTIQNQRDRGNPNRSLHDSERLLNTWSGCSHIGYHSGARVEYFQNNAYEFNISRRLSRRANPRRTLGVGRPWRRNHHKEDDVGAAVKPNLTLLLCGVDAVFLVLVAVEFQNVGIRQKPLRELDTERLGVHFGIVKGYLHVQVAEVPAPIALDDA